jgi:hypothetical protein
LQSPCPETDIVFLRAVDVGEHRVRLPVSPPVRLVVGGGVGLDVDGSAAYPTDAAADPAGIVSTRREEETLWLTGQAPGTSSLGVKDSYDREAGLEVTVTRPSALHVAATATAEDSPLLLPPAATAAGVGLLPGGDVWLGVVPRDDAGATLAGSVPTIGEPPDRTGPVFSVVGLEAGSAALVVTGHGRERRVPLAVTAR